MSYPETYHHDDHDGGCLTVDPSKQPYNAGIWVDSRECFVPLAKVAELVNAIWDRARQSAHEHGSLPCPDPKCGPCSMDQADEDGWVRCRRPDCPNAERFTFAADRGWARLVPGTWLCPEHAAPTSEEPQR